MPSQAGNESNIDAFAGQKTGDATEFETSANAFNGLEFEQAVDNDPKHQECTPSASVETGRGAANPLIMDLPVVMKVVLGSAKMALASVANLTKGSVVKLDKKVGDPADIFVNGRLIARGEVVVIDQDANRFGVVLTQIGGLPPASKKSF